MWMRQPRCGAIHPPGIEIMHYQKLWLTLDEIKEIHPIHDAAPSRGGGGVFPTQGHAERPHPRVATVGDRGLAA
jgi:hypothetical protein